MARNPTPNSYTQTVYTHTIENTSTHPKDDIGQKQSKFYDKIAYSGNHLAGRSILASYFVCTESRDEITPYQLVGVVEYTGRGLYTCKQNKK